MLLQDWQIAKDALAKLKRHVERMNSTDASEEEEVAAVKQELREALDKVKSAHERIKRLQRRER